MEILSTVGSFSWIIWAVAAFLWYRIGKLRGRHEAREEAALARQLAPRAMAEGQDTPIFSVAFSTDNPPFGARTRYTRWLTPAGNHGVGYEEVGFDGVQPVYRVENTDQLALYRHDGYLFCANIVQCPISLNTLEELRGIGMGLLSTMSSGAFAEVMQTDKRIVFRVLCAIDALPGFLEYLDRLEIDAGTFFMGGLMTVPVPTQMPQPSPAPRRQIDLGD